MSQVSADNEEVSASNISIDGVSVPFTAGQTIMEAASAVDIYIPHLCHHPDLSPHGSCRLCLVATNGRLMPACTAKAVAGQQITNMSDEINQKRRQLTQLLFVEGNHYCPACEVSGNCQLQATAYALGMTDNHFQLLSSIRKMDASHPQIVLDLDRCINCARCERASIEKDQQHVFSLGGRGIHSHLVVNSTTGKLADAAISRDDAAATVCPVGAILIRDTAYKNPIGERQFDKVSIADQPERNHE